jgi:L-alanine-DL-glutamate epimerase-like enolase superfamily enzyme
MKIAKIEAIPFRVPMREVVKFATGQLAELEHVLVRIHTDQGLIGQAEAPARPMVYGESAVSIVAAVRDWFAPAIVGLDPFAIEHAWARLDKVEHNQTAKAAIDIALHDIIGQATSVPLHRLLGGWSTEIELSHILGLGTPGQVADQAREVMAKYGFRTLKLKAGIDPRRDTAMVRAVREAVGPDVRLHVDCNHGYSSLVATRTVPEWEPYDIAWVEEPCPGWDVRGRALVAAATTIPLMADESCTTVAAVNEEIRRGTCRLMSLKNARTGYTLSRKIIDLCEANGVVPVTGSQGDTEIGALASAHFHAAHRITASGPAELTFFVDAADSLFIEPIAIRDGKFTVPDRPGVGLHIDEKKLERYRIDRR